MSIRIALVGPGKIARDRHIPTLQDSAAFELAAIVSRRGETVDELPVFPGIDELLASDVEIDAITFCSPPAGRYEQVLKALQAGKHVAIEKPPATTLAELHALEQFPLRPGQSLFTTWHCQHNRSVEIARDLLVAEGLRTLDITWHESVWRWHPGQEWIWEPGGFGVFDPGINALSIMTEILPAPAYVTSAHLQVPANRAMPIAADISFAAPGVERISARFDWRHRESERWDIDIVTGTGRTIRIERGGGGLVVDGEVQITGPKQEYPMIYEAFAELVRQGGSRIDAAPMRLTADTFLLASRQGVEPFTW